MLNGKQRARLRARANGIATILQVGKDGINENLIVQTNDALTARELIKLRVLENAPLGVKDAAARLADATKSECVQVIGTRFVLFRRNPDKKQYDEYL